MTDMEKVVKGILGAIDDKIDEQSYPYFEESRIDMGLTREVSVALLKDALDLLKERETVEPDVQYNRTRLAWWLHKCSACQTLINFNDNFCRGCGRELKWE